ncbi:MAG: hypothetical protein RBU23_02670 [Candidatus Auribacterota bacterium]|jgi:hypothetical protein|nr:hypothetical protein [Candidatus Auribacterota bacterium]
MTYIHHVAVCLLFVFVHQVAASSPEFMINTYYKDTQHKPAVASNLTNIFVVWQSDVQDGDGQGIYGQIIGADDAAKGAMFRVNELTSGNQSVPVVATDGTNFMTVWQSFRGLTGYDIVARLFDQNGMPLTGDILVSSEPDDQAHASIASNGSSFLVVWESRGKNGSLSGICGQYFSLEGDKIGGEITINAYEGANSRLPSIASCQNTYMVSWYENIDGVCGNICAQLLDDQGILIADRIVLSDPVMRFIAPKVATYGWHYLICWTGSIYDSGYDIKILGQWVSTEGNLIGAPICFARLPVQNIEYVSLAVDTGGIDFMLTWHQFNGVDWDIYAQLVGLTGIPIGQPFAVTNSSGTNELSAAVAHNGNSYTVVWTSNKDLGSFNIFGQNLKRTLTRGSEEILVNSTTYGHQRSPVAAGNSNGFIALYEHYSQNENQYDIYAQLFDNDYQKVGSEFLVNINVALNQRYPAIASDGQNYLVVWASYEQDGDEYGIYARLTDNEGSPVGAEIAVNTFTNGRQINPAVVFNGLHYLVVWESYGQDGSGSDVCGQLISKTGQAVGGEFRINTYTANNQQEPALAVCGERTCVVWQSYGQDDCGYGIYAKLLDQTGNALTGELKIFDGEGVYSVNPSVTANRNHFFVVWQNYMYFESDNDTTLCPAYYVLGKGILYTGQVFGDEVQISLEPSMNHLDPQAVSDGNDFFVVWSSYDNDGVGFEVYGKYYSSLLAVIDRQFKLNLTSDQWQHKPAVCSVNNKTFILWESYLQDGSELGVYGCGLTLKMINENRYTLYIPQSIRDNFEDMNVEFAFADLNDDGYFDLCFTEILDDGSEGKIYIYWGTEIDCYSMYTVLNEQGEILQDNFGFNYGDVSSGLYYLNNTWEWDDSYTLFYSYHLDRWSFWSNSGDGHVSPYDKYYVCGQLISGNGKTIGTEFYLNLDYDSYQYNPAGASNGNTYLITWFSGNDIFARMYNSCGEPLDDKIKIDSSAVEFRLDYYTTGMQNDALIASNGIDYFLVWESFSQGGNGYDLYGRLISHSSKISESNLCLNSNKSDNQRNVSIASNGVRYCAVWESDHSGTNGIYARMFDSRGVGANVEFLISNTNVACSNPCVTSDGMNYLVTWSQNSYLYGRYISFDGTLMCNAFEISQGVGLSSVASDGTTYFVVWESGSDIHGQVFTGDGLSIGQSMRINDFIFANQSTPVVASNGTTYMVSWCSEGIDFNITGIAGKFFHSTGSSFSQEYRLNAYVNNDQRDPWLVSNGNDYFVSWASNQVVVNEETTYYSTLDCDGYPNGISAYFDASQIFDNCKFDILFDSDGNLGAYVCFEAENGLIYDVYYTDSLDNLWEKIGQSIIGDNISASLSLNNIPTLIGSTDKVLTINPQSGFFKIKARLADGLDNP